MTCVFLDPCKSYNNQAETTVIGQWATYSTLTYAAAGGRDGAGALLVAQNVPASIALACGVEATIGFVGRFTQWPASITSGFIRFMEGATLHVDLRVNTSGQVYATRNGTALAGAVGTTQLVQNVDYVFQFRAKLHDTTGTVELWINDVQQFAVTALDTRNAGTPLLDTFIFGGGGGNAFQMQLSEVYINDTNGSVNNGIAGSYRIFPRRVSAAGNYAQFTPSASTNASNVDDTQGNDGDTTYNSDATPGNRDSFQFGAVPWTAGTVLAIRHCIVARKDDAGVRTIAPMQRQSSTNYDGTSRNLTTAYAGYSEIIETNPSTAVAYTTAEMRATTPEFGYKDVA